jgi:glutamate racemase
LTKPIAVFDAGIGSYAAVAAIRRLLPQQDILYLADRASFPYGGKSRAELLAVLRRTLLYLNAFDPAAVLVASNAPSITVLDEIADMIGVPVLGVRPPIASALDIAGAGDVAVLGVRSMVLSPELRTYVDTEAGENAPRVHLVDASLLVDLVESGAFLFDAEATGHTVNAFVDDLEGRYPNLAAVTLSSTHLPWLLSYLKQCRPAWPFLDPLDDAVAAIVPHSIAGTGALLGLVTENERLPVAEFRSMLDRLGVTLPLQCVRL